jgi:hypothetical protein
MADTILNWFKTYESIAIWLEGIALLAIFIWDRIDSHQQHKQTLAQMEIMRNQALATETAANAANKNTKALINSERAWMLVDIGKLPPFDPDPNQLQFLWIFPTIKNCGKTVARIKRIRGFVKLIPEGQDLPIVPEYILGQGFDEQVDIVLPPDVPVQARLGVSGDEFTKVREGKFSLFVHGFIELFRRYIRRAEA